jgi:CBS domain-containing protein
MKTREIMSSHVYTVSPADSLAWASKLMWDHDIGFLPVVSDLGDTLGTVTDRDILMAVYTRGIRLADACVSSAMSNQLFTIGPQATLAELQALMCEHLVRRVPVVDEFGTLVGVATLADLCSHVASRVGGDDPSSLSIAQTLAKLSAHRHAEDSSLYQASCSVLPADSVVYREQTL